MRRSGQQLVAREGVATFVEAVLNRHRPPDEEVYAFLGRGEEVTDRLTWGQLEGRVRRLAWRLRGLASPGERVLLLHPSGLEFPVAFLATLAAGLVAVPCQPPRGRRDSPRLRALAEDSEPSLVLAASEVLRARESVIAGSPSLAAIPWIEEGPGTDQAGVEHRPWVDEAPVLAGAGVAGAGVAVDATDDQASDDAPWPAPPSPDDLAFLQYTSGSTGDPKGVEVRHRNLVHNQEMIRRAFGQDEGSVVVSWLPLYHDMGLIGGLLQPLYVGGRCVLMSPASFLQRPARWLEAISRFGATTSGGPSFAYELCVQRVDPRRAGLDLSSWRVAFNGAEPVRAEVLDRFAESFADLGFDRRAFFPCYGLAEATLLVTGRAPDAEPTVGVFDRDSVERGDVERAPEGSDPESTRALVGCGGAWLDQRVLVVDPESHHPLDDLRVGEIWVAGGSVAGGYWRRGVMSRAVFEARLEDGDPEASHGFLRTGDLGFWSEGELYVTGRLKDLIVLRGRNLYPQDVEWAVETSHPGLASAAAFAVDPDEVGSVVEGGTSGERLVVVQEVVRRLANPRRRDELAGVARAIRRAVAQAHDVALDRLVLVAPGRLPKTSSGKVRRRACREQLLSGALETLFDDGGSAAAPAVEPTPVPLDAPTLAGLPEGSRRAAFRRWLDARLTLEAGFGPPAELDRRATLPELGLDSLAIAALAQAVESDFGLTLPFDSVFDLSLEQLEEQVLATVLDAAVLDATALDAGRAVTVPQAPSLLERQDETEGDHPTAYGQRALWYLDRLTPSAATSIAAAAQSHTRLDAAALAQALTRLVARHPALRTTFVEQGGELRQRVHTELAPDFAVARADEATLEAFLESEARAPFDLETGSPIRVRLVSTTEAHYLLWVVHHAVADLASLTLLLRELGGFYGDAIAIGGHDVRSEDGRERSSLGEHRSPVPTLRQSDLAHWQRKVFGDGAEGQANPSLRYWLEALAPPPPALDLPVDRPRPAEWRGRGLAVHRLLDPSLGETVTARARGLGCTPSVVLAGAFQALLLRLTGQPRLAVAMPALGRRQPELADVVGFFVNPVVLVAEGPADPAMGDWLPALQRQMARALAHQAVPFALLVERLEPRRDPARPPLVQALFAHQTTEREGDERLAAFALGQEGVVFESGPLELVSKSLDLGATSHEIALMTAQVEGRLSARLDLAADLFDRTTGERWLRAFETVLNQLVETPERRLSELDLLGRGERHQLVHEWSAVDGGAIERSGDTVTALLEAQARRTPTALALIDGERRLTYGDLHRRARHLARRLVALGVRPEERVGVTAGRTAELVVALLAVLRAGGAYLALDPSYPEARLRGMAADGGVRWVLHDGETPPWLPDGVAAVALEEALDGIEHHPDSRSQSETAAPVHPDQLAYVLFTSGSTGRPKGVAVTQRGAAALVRWAREHYDDHELGGALAATSINFDLSVFELFAPLAWGGTVILAPDALALPRLPARDAVRLVNTVPSVLAELLAGEGLPASVTTVNLAGEALRRELVEAAEVAPEGARRTVWNLYGPSEDTTYSTAAQVSGHGQGLAPAIGRPLPGGRARVLDRRLRPVPSGAHGELCLGGVGLARGYLGQPARTAEVFVPDPGATRPGARLYRTGDRVRFRADGELDFLGRFDHQVKIRGFRIEPGEVEALLAGHPAVAEAAVVVSEGGPTGPRLVAHWVPAADATEPAQIEAAETEPAQIKAAETETALRRHLEDRLPPYLRPGGWVPWPRLPRLGSGKIDRRTLVDRAPVAMRESAPPRGPDEILVAGLVAELLGRDAVGRNDDFFALGGHSLLAARLVSRLQQERDVSLPLAAVLRRPTVAGLAEVLGEAETEPIRPAETLPHPSPLPPDSGGEGTGKRRRPLVEELEHPPGPLSFTQERLWFLDRLDPGSRDYTMPFVVELDGRLDHRALDRAVTAVIARHEVLRSHFPSTDGRPRVEVEAPTVIRVPEVDLRGLPEGRRAEVAEALLGGWAHRSFDLARGPLWRVLWLRAEGDQLAWNLHHTVADGRSLEILWRDLAAAYEGVEPEGPKLQFGDVARWQHQRMSARRLRPRLEFWRRRLAGVPALDLPTDRPHGASARSGMASPGRGRLLPVAFDPATAAALGRLASERGTTVFTVLAALYAGFLHRLAGQDDLAVGTAVSLRPRPELRQLVGPLVDTVALRSTATSSTPVSELVEAMGERLLEAHDQGDVPFERVVEAVAPERRTDAPALFQTMLVLQGEAPSSGLGGLGGRARELDRGASPFHWTLSLRGGVHGLSGVLELDRQLFDPTTGLRMLRSLEVFLRAGAEQPERTLGALPWLTAAERHQLCLEWPTAPSARHQRIAGSVAGWLAASLRRSPGSTALIDTDDEAWSFLRLAERVVTIQDLLGAVDASGPVAVVLDRGADAVATFLAVLVGGGAYLPLDPQLPEERMAFVLADARVTRLVGRGESLRRLPEGPWSVIDLDRAPASDSANGGDGSDPATMARRLDAPPPHPEAPAYVLYTSGSTGRPKGVVVPHRALVDFVAHSIEDYGVASDDRVLQFNSLVFDASVEEIYPTLAVGGMLVLRSELGSTAELLDRCRRTGVTVLDLPTGYWHTLVSELVADPEAEWPPSVRLVILGGEQALVAPLRAFRRRVGTAVRVVNSYGPTETTVVVSRWRAREASTGATAQPIGGPVAGTALRVVDPRLEPTALGQPGELVIAGDGLATGYLGRPAITAASFVPDPLGAPGARLYRSGDRVRWLAEGVLEFIGRSDAQVKVRGFRVEPGEIEAVLVEHPEVAQGAVVVGRGGRELVAFVASANPTDASGLGRELLQRLRSTLPAHLVPSVVEVLDSLPTLATGKVDRRRLATLAAERAPVESLDPAVPPSSPAVSPSSPAEELVAGVWRDLLGVDSVGADGDFFALGGHSLLATQAVSRLRRIFGVELPLRRLFEAPTVAEVARAMTTTGALDGSPLPALEPRAVGDEGEAPLTFAQERLWFLHQLDPTDSAYNVAAAVDLEGPLDRQRLAAAFDTLVRRQPSLRTVFEGRAGQPIQRTVEPTAGVGHGVGRVDLRWLDDAQRRQEVERLGRSFARRPFDLATPPLRSVLLVLGEERHRWLLVLHHLVCDGWSMDVLVREWATLYTSGATGAATASLPPLPLTLADVATWQRRVLEGERLEELLAIEGRRLADLPVLELPTDRPRTADTGSAGRRLVGHLPASLVARLEALGRRHHGTLFMVFLAAYRTLLVRWSGQNDLAVGAPVANRRDPRLESLAGFLVDTLVFRTPSPAESPTPERFVDLLARTRGDALAAFASQDLPFERLVEALVPRRDLSTPPLVQTLFALQPAAAPHPPLGGLRLEPTALDTGGVKFDLALALEPQTKDGASRGLEMVLELRRDLFDVTTGLRFLAHFRALLEQVVEHPVAPLDRLAHTPRAEHHQLLHEWAEGGQARTAAADTLDGRFFAQARRTPDAPALVWRGETWTYAVLASHALELATRLRDSGVGEGDRVALLLPREPRLVAAILAVLAAGSAYVPLDPAYPEERQQHILGDSGAVLLLASEAPSWALPTHCRRMLVEPLADTSSTGGASIASSSRTVPPVETEATRRLAYLIYTSGSTGLPKGVAIEHCSALAMVDWATATYSATELDGVLAGTSVCFDLSIFELFAPLTSGGRVVLAGSALELHDPDVAGQVRMVNTVPSAIAELTRERELPPSVRTVNLAGEPLRRSLVDRVYDAGPRVERIFDLYGPSEDTTYSTFAVARRDDRGEPAIGRPLPGTRAYVIDRRGRLLSPPVVGELVLGGVGVARGYVGRPAQTAERFVPDPWGAAGERLYRTGDRVRWGHDGQLHYLGRFDHQVKVRGYRIELGEIETRLRALPGVGEAVVVAREDRGEGLVAGLRQQLVAYVGQADPSARVDAEALRRNLAEGLPDYMVPHAFVVLDALPQTPNGKIDRAALPEPDTQGGGLGSSTGSARGSELEALVAGLFAEVLLGDRDLDHRDLDHRDRDEGRPEVAADDDFFRLGGHSLLATQLVARLGPRCGVDLGVRRVFEHPTPRTLARAIEEVRRGDALPPRPALVASEEAGDVPLSAAQERLWFLHQLEPELGLYTMPVVTQIEGEVVPAALAAALGAIGDRHEVLRTVYPEGENGPVQRVLAPETVALPEVDLGALPSARRGGEARRLATVFCALPFDLAGGPPLRALGLRLATDEHWLVLALHHIAADGWSLGVLLAELAELYDATLEGRAPCLPPLAVQMGDVARWQRQALSDDRLTALLGPQRARLAGAPQHLPLPLDRPRPEHPSGRGGVVPLALGRDATGALMRVAEAQGVTPMMVVTTAVVALLRRLSGVDDLLLGTPVANRLDPALEPLIGCLVNTLVLRSHLPGDPTFEQLLASTRDAALAAYDSQELPFERLVAELDPSRDLARSPLFQVLVIWQDTPRPALRLGSCALRPVEGLGRTAKFDLTFELRLEEGALCGELEFADDLFERGTAERLATALGVVFEALAEDPGRRLSALDGPAFEGWGAVEERPETPLLAVAPDEARTVGDVDEGPVGPVETTLGEIWCEVLDLERVGRHQDFFALGGHSLLAARVASRLRRRLGVEIPLRAIFETRTVAALAERLGSAGEAKAPAVTIEHRQVSPDEADTAPLAFAQERLFFLDRLHPGDPQYHMPAALDLRGPLDIAALAVALAALARRHGALRTTFGVSSAGETFQRLAPPSSVVTAAWWPSVVDLSGLADEGLGERVLERLLARYARQPFDLDSGPLVRALLVRRSADVHVLSLVSHHLVSDGWSQEILVRELGTLYSVFRSGETAGDRALDALPALPVTYADFARWQRQELTGERLKSLLAWWRQTLHGAPPVLELPIDRPRPTQRDARGAWVEVDWPRSTAEAVEMLARQHGATPFMVLMAFWGAVLERFTGRRDLVVGTPVAGRPLPELEGLLGLFVDTLALRLDLAEDPTVQTLVERVRGTVLDAFEHQTLPFERLVAELAPARDLGHTPLVQGVLAVQNQPASRPRASGLELEPRDSHGGSAKFDLTLALEPRSDGIGGQLEYAVALFDRTTVERLLDQLRRLVEDAAAQPEARVGELARLSPAERHQLGIEVPGRVVAPTATRQSTQSWQQVDTITPGAHDPGDEVPRLTGLQREAPESALHHLFFVQAEEHPERIALVAGEQRFTYGELAAQALALATRLRALGLGAEQRVAILLERGPRQVVAILGVLASGAAYVPVDPNHPVERIAHVLRDAEVEAVVGEARPGSAREAVPPEVPVLILDDGEAAQATTATGVGFDWRRTGGDRLAYVLYTSGSTGRPKGVGVTHRNVLALLAAGEATFDFGPDDVWSLFHSTAFDFSVWELWGALAWGGRVVLVSETLRRSPRDFGRLLVDEGVTVLDQTPSAFRALAEVWRRENGAPASLRWVIFGGEGLDGRTLRSGSFPWAEEGPTLVNMYGITETTVHVTRRALEATHRELDGPVPVGEALPGWGFGVYDRRLRLQPPGAPGEIGVSGIGLARGYLGRPALTAERFVPDPETREPGGRLYRSGDLGRRRADGEVEVLGRIDGQVKIRGHRIELQDVAAALDRHPSVGRAEVVLLDRGDDPQLVACVLPVAGADEATLDPDGLRRWSQRTLPEAMRPAAFLALDQLPLTVNGKLDRRALEQHARELIGAALRRTAGAYVEPRTEDERALAAIWAEVLGLEQVGVEDSFFDLGGHSLLMVRVQTRLEQHLGRPVPILDLFEHPTVAALATHLAASSSSVEMAAAEPEASILEQRRERVAGRRARSQQRRRQRSRRSRGNKTDRGDKPGGER